MGAPSALALSARDKWLLEIWKPANTSTLTKTPTGSRYDDKSSTEVDPIHNHFRHHRQWCGILSQVHIQFDALGVQCIGQEFLHWFHIFKAIEICLKKPLFLVCVHLNLAAGLCFWSWVSQVVKRMWLGRLNSWRVCEFSLIRAFWLLDQICAAVHKYSGYADIRMISRTHTNQNSWPVLPWRLHTSGKKRLPRLACKLRHKHSPKFLYYQWNTFSNASHKVWNGRFFVRWKHWQRTI